MVGLLEVDGFRVVQGGAYAVLAEMGEEGVACAETERAKRCAVPADAPARKGKRAYVLSLAGQSPSTWADYARR